MNPQINNHHHNSTSTATATAPPAPTTTAATTATTKTQASTPQTVSHHQQASATTRLPPDTSSSTSTPSNSPEQPCSDNESDIDCTSTISSTSSNNSTSSIVISSQQEKKSDIIMANNNNNDSHKLIKKSQSPPILTKDHHQHNNTQAAAAAAALPEDSEIESDSDESSSSTQQAQQAAKAAAAALLSPDHLGLHHFRPVFYDTSNKRRSTNYSSSNNSITTHHHHHHHHHHDNSSTTNLNSTMTSTTTTPPSSADSSSSSSSIPSSSTISDLCSNKRARIVKQSSHQHQHLQKSQSSLIHDILIPTPISPSSNGNSNSSAANTSTTTNNTTHHYHHNPLHCQNSSSLQPPTTTSNTPLSNVMCSKHQQQQQEKKNKNEETAVVQQQQQQQPTQPQPQQASHQPKLTNIKRYRSRSLPNVIFSALRRHHHHNSTASNSQHHHHHHHHHRIGSPSESVINAVPSMAFVFPQQQPFFPAITNTTTTATATATAASGTAASASVNATASTQKRSIPPPLPPVSLQSLREIDLHEILKNPQLRHDILFDPQLQFRPNLDGERGRKKKMAVDKYWEDVQRECENYIINKEYRETESRLPCLFQTLKDILISLLPSKDVELVNEVMDIELLNQQLKNFAFDFVSLAKWLSTIFKSHCAPMRDSWVDEMTLKFIKAKDENSITSLVEGFRMIFSILEAMKLDVANHQIRILRPVLVETAVEFERNYFTQMINRCKLNLQDSTLWFINNYKEKPEMNLKELSTLSILKLLSCRHMVTQFPSSLSFDHARLVLLRADIRQLVCLQLCILLYKQMCYQYNASPSAAARRAELLKPTNVNKLKKEILAIVTDENGNIKWTRNVRAIALQLSKAAACTSGITEIPPATTVDFAFNWLLKQTQPSSQVYGIMEEKIFNKLQEFVKLSKDEDLLKEEVTTTATESTTTSTTTTTTKINNTPSSESNTVTGDPNPDDDYDINQLRSRIAKLCNFHWGVFGNTYTETVNKLANTNSS